MSKHFTTVMKVRLGFTLMTLLLVAAVGLTIWQVARTQAIMRQLVNQSSPMSESSLRVISGVNDAVAKVRGFLLLGDERFKAEWAAAYTDAVDPNLATLKNLVGEFGNPTQQEQVKAVKITLAELKGYQTQQLAIGRTGKNFPAQELMQSQAGPRADEVIAAVSAMIDEESKLAATPERKQLLFQLANFRGSFTHAVATLRDYIGTGKESGRELYEQQRQASAKFANVVAAAAALLLGAQSQHWARVESGRSEFETLATKIIEIRRSDKWDVAVSILRDNVAPTSRRLQDALQRFITDLGPQNKANRDTLVAMTSLLAMLEWTLLVVGIAASIGMATVTIRSVKAAINAVSAATQHISSSTTEVTTGSQQQVASLSQTATSLNEITTTAEEFKTTMQEFADRARSVQQAADETAKRSADGRVMTQESGAHIEQVRANSLATGESMLSLAEQMRRIGDITATVNEIAEQTKLLALNASIEAARAGDNGRGFAVVATHVRELANQSKESAGRIETLIGDTQKSMQDVASRSEEGSRLSEDATASMQQMAQAFEEIAEAIEQTREAMSQISSGAKQQERGIAELVASITQIDSGSKESLAAATQTQRAIASIDEQTKGLNQLVKTF